AFYMFRLYFMIFHNKQSHIESHHGEGSLSMKIPLVVLTICTIASGFVPFASFVTSDGIPLATHIDIIFSILSVGLAVIAILFAARLYYRQNELPDKMASSLGTLYHAAYGKFYIDEIYLFITQKIIFNLVGKPAAWIDKHIVDGFMNLLATITEKISALIKGLQSGKVQAYALYFFGGIAGLAVLFIYLWKN
ncbi:MAG TPA: NADH-quinone oxidoreductase subunit L, partial [Chitinophagaceae bacterium]